MVAIINFILFIYMSLLRKGMKFFKYTEK